jgi:hypothetical protein
LARAFNLTVWRGGQKFYAQGYPHAQFVTRRGAAEKYSRQQAADLKRRFRRVKLQLKLEEIAEAEASRSSEPISDQARQFLLFD